MRVNRPIAAVLAATALLVAGCSGDDGNQGKSEDVESLPEADFESSSGTLSEDSLEEAYGIVLDTKGKYSELVEISCVDTDLVISNFGGNIERFPDAVQCSDGDPRINKIERGVLEQRREALLAPPPEIQPR